MASLATIYFIHLRGIGVLKAIVLISNVLLRFVFTCSVCHWSIQNEFSSEIAYDADSPPQQSKKQHHGQLGIERYYSVQCVHVV